MTSPIDHEQETEEVFIFQNFEQELDQELEQETEPRFIQENEERFDRIEGRFIQENEETGDRFSQETEQDYQRFLELLQVIEEEYEPMTSPEI